MRGVAMACCAVAMLTVSGVAWAGAKEATSKEGAAGAGASAAQEQGSQAQEAAAPAQVKEVTPGQESVRAKEALQALAIGATAPMTDVKMLAVDGRRISIGEVKGEKGTLVIFTCNACPWVKAWETRIAELGNAYAKRGVGVIAINPNDPSLQAEDGYEVMQERAKQRGLAFPYVVDATSELARAFGATRTPEAFLFDAAGRLVYHGAVDDNAKQPAKVAARWLRDALEATLAGKPVATQETKALGCAIKYRARAASS